MLEDSWKGDGIDAEAEEVDDEVKDVDAEAEEVGM
jgi:hypothetical protein